MVATMPIVARGARTGAMGGPAAEERDGAQRPAAAPARRARPRGTGAIRMAPPFAPLLDDARRAAPPLRARLHEHDTGAGRDPGADLPGADRVQRRAARAALRRRRDRKSTRLNSS